MNNKILNFVKKNVISLTILLICLSVNGVTLAAVNNKLEQIPVTAVEETVFYCQKCNNQSDTTSKFCGKCGEANNWDTKLAVIEPEVTPEETIKDDIEEPVKEIVEETSEPVVTYPEVVDLPDTDTMVDSYINGDVIGYMDGHEIYGDKNNPSYQPFQDYIDKLPKNADGCIQAEDGRCYSYVGSFETWRLYKCVKCHEDNHNSSSQTCGNCS